MTQHGEAEFKAFIFFVNGSEEKLKSLSKEEKAGNIALGILDSEEHEGMKLYKINPKAKSTVLLYTNRNIKAKFVNYKGKEEEKKLAKKIELICR